MPDSTPKPTLDMLRAYASTNGYFDTEQLQRDLGYVPDEYDKPLQSLVRGKQLEEVTRSYKWVAESQPIRTAPVDDQIWSAMCMFTSFTVDDIVELTQATSGYVSRRLKQYREDGFVVLRGRKLNQSRTKRVRRWAVTWAGRKLLTSPRLLANKPDPLISMANRLNRMMHLGMYRQRPEVTQQIIDLVSDILKEVEQVREQMNGEAA